MYGVNTENLEYWKYLNYLKITGGKTYRCTSYSFHTLKKENFNMTLHFLIDHDIYIQGNGVKKWMQFVLYSAIIFYVLSSRTEE